MSANLKNQFIKGVLWTATSNLGAVIINFTLGIYLARVLGPEAYGIIGMVLVITGFSRLFLDFGFGEALIQKENIQDKDYSTIFWYNIIISVIITVSIYFSANFIAEFYKNVKLIPFAKVMSLFVLINSIGMVQKIKLEKEMRFKEIGISEILSSFISFSFAIFFASNGYGVWSLVILHLLKLLIYAVLIWWFSKWLPSFIFSFASIRKLLKFSFAIFINGVFETIASVIDKVLIGRNLGELTLGIYSKSLSTVRMPVNTIMSAIGRVIYPVFSKIQNDTQRIFNIYCQFILGVSSVIFPCAIIFYVFGSDIVNLVFGSKWVEMIPIFKIMSLGIVVLPFNILIDSVVKSIGKAKHLNFITFYEKPITIICLVIGVYLGELYYVAIMVNVALFINFFLKSYIMILSLKKSLINLMMYHVKSFKILVIPGFSLLLLHIIGYNEKSLKLIVLLLSFFLSFFIFRNQVIFPFVKLYHNSKSK